MRELDCGLESLKARPRLTRYCNMSMLWHRLAQAVLRGNPEWMTDTTYMPTHNG